MSSLDMHQDLYSVRYSDGAPEWATLTEGKEHVTGPVWSDSYLISPAVQAAFDHFWNNAPAQDGIGLQDHYAAAWQYVAKRFAGHPALVGYDLMNEPFEGASVLRGQAQLLDSRFAMELARRLGKEPNSVREIAAMWQTPGGRAEITRMLNDIELYTAFVDAQSEHNQQFERTHLQPMYQRVAHAIRQVDSRSALFLETSYHGNSGVRSGIQPVHDTNGQPDLRQVFAPHAYDIVVDTPQIGAGNNDRVELILGRHLETAKRLKMPLVIGEWGAFGLSADEGVVTTARFIQRAFERMLCSDTYWDYGPKIDQQVYFHTLKRSLPQRIAGELIEYRSDPESGEFVCRWNESTEITAPTIVYLTEKSSTETVRVDNSKRGFEVTPVAAGSKDVLIIIPPNGKGRQRVLSVW